MDGVVKFVSLGISDAEGLSLVAKMRSSGMEITGQKRNIELVVFRDTEDMNPVIGLSCAYCGQPIITRSELKRHLSSCLVAR